MVSRVHPTAVSTSNMQVSDQMESPPVTPKDTVPDEAFISAVPQSKRILCYFQWLSANGITDVNFDYFNNLIENGADINAVDEMGKSPLHFIASELDTASAEFALSNGALVDAEDIEGRTPLHIAAYCNQTEIIDCLLEHRAQLNKKSKEGQTPVHFAIRSSAIESLNLLIEKGASYDCTDNQGRTPLHLGAELDRSLAVSLLLSLKIPANCDSFNNANISTLVPMIFNMPEMAKIGLEQYRKVDISERHQEYLLGSLESLAHTDVITPFEAAVQTKSLEILSHPIMNKLLEIKWQILSRWMFLFEFGLYILFIIVWTALFVFPPVQSKHIYNFPMDLWRVILGVLGVALLLYHIGVEIAEYTISYIKIKKLKTSLKNKSEQDIEHCIGKEFEEERNYILTKLKKAKRLQPGYFDDAWNYLDTSAYLFLSITVILHIIDIFFHNPMLALWIARIGCVAIILVWTNLLSFARASEFLGSFVNILTHLLKNIAVYFILFAVFYFPYVASFWLIIGGDQQSLANITAPSEELTSIHRLIVMLFRMTLVDDYPYQNIRDADELTGTLLVISFLIINAIIGLNLFIALLSDTFQRIYDKSSEIAKRQKAELVVSLDGKTPWIIRRKFLNYINRKFNPLSEYYDDDEDAVQATSTTKIIHKSYNMLYKLIDKNESDVTKTIKLCENLLEEVENLKKDVREIKSLVKFGPHSATQHEYKSRTDCPRLSVPLAPVKGFMSPSK